MTAAERTIEVYDKLGVMRDCYRTSTTFNRDTQQWEVIGSFQNDQGRRFGKVADFDDVDDAVAFAEYYRTK